MKWLNAIFCTILLLLAICPEAPAQEYNSLYQYFEADSIAKPGYSSIEKRITQINIVKGRENKKVNTTESFYDETGRLMREERSSSMTDFETELIFGYDSIFNRINYILQTERKVKQEAFGRYDEQGRLAEIIYCQEDQPCQIQYYDYDEENTERLYISRQTIELQFGKEKETKSIFGVSASASQKGELFRERFFDPEGNLEESRAYAKDTIAGGWLYEYNTKGLLSKMWVYNSIDKKLAVEYEYDEKSRLSKESKHFLMDDKRKILPYQPESNITYFEYNKKNRLVRTENTTGPSYKRITEFIYNER